MAEFHLLQEKAYRYLREQILSDTLKYDMVYSEARIAQELGCSRTPVKDALARLSHARYIDILPSRGFMLHRLTESDIRNTFQTRVAIEGFCAVTMMQQRESDTGRAAVAQLDGLLQALRALEDGSRPVEFLERDMAFHAALVGFVPNRDFAELYEAQSYRIEMLASKSLREEGRCAETVREHEAILCAIRDGSVQDCYEAVLRHNDSTYRRDLEILRREFGTVLP